MGLVLERDLPRADEIITNIVKCRKLTQEQRTQCQTILENAYALHKLRYSPF
jgi:uracil-DNA glycosylase